MRRLHLRGDEANARLRLEAVLFTLTAVIVVVILVVILVNPLRVNRDASLHLLIGQLLIRGAVPYVDYVEINPPLIHYLHVIPVVLAKWIGVNPIPVFLLLILALSVWSITTAVYLLSRDVPVQGVLLGSVMAVAVAVLDLKLFTTNEFGEREHIFFLLIVPYVVLRWLRYRGRLGRTTWLAVLVGLAAGVGACIKPHFLIILLAIEAYCALAEGRRFVARAPEVFAVLAVGVGYAFFLLVMPGDMKAGLMKVVESVLAGGYRAYGDQGAIGLFLDQEILLLVGLAPFLFLRSRRNPDDAESLLLTMCAFVLASLVVYASQGRGFAYQLIPGMGAEYFVALSLVLILAPRARSVIWARTSVESVWGARGLSIAWLTTMAFVLVAVVKGIGDLSPTAVRSAATLADADVIAVIRDNSAKDDGVLVVSTMAEPFRLVLQAGRPLASKYIPTNPISFGISEIHSAGDLYDPSYQLPASVQSFLDELEKSISTTPPALIIIDNRTSCVGCPEGFQVSEFLRARGVYDRVISGNYSILLDAERFVILKRVSPATGGEGLSQVAFE
jgi:hypothetical protein